MEEQKPHAIFIPLPLQGHVNPSINLAINLASHGFTITFVNTQYNHQQIVQSQPSAAAGDIFAGAREAGLDIRYTTVSDGLPLGFDRDLMGDEFLEHMLDVFPGYVDELVGNMSLSAVDPPLTCLIADTFYAWPSVIAKKHNLVYVSFWTEPALVFDIYYHLDLLKINGHFASQDNRKDAIDYIPGVRSIQPKDLMSYFQDTDIWTVLHRIVYKSFDDVKLSDFVLCNTVYELEPEPISALQQKKPFYAIGPIVQTGLTKCPKPIVPMNFRAESPCTQWLDSKPPGSVLYISFGSFVQISRADFLEIAYGLLGCEASFVWVLRPDTVGYGGDNSLPVELEEGLKRKGLIVSWCSQVDVIVHKAIGGFLTHCGWNSVLESAQCGIPMLCFPVYADQFTNRKLVVDDWRAGINLCDEKLVRREEVVEKINSLMSENSTNEVRRNAQKVQDVIEQALGPNGSSRRNLDEFVQALKVKIKEKMEILGCS